MLHIILLIFKIIGIILLCMIGIVLLVTACVLFVPVRYRIRVTREEGEDSPPVDVYVKATWLLHIVNILVRYPAQVIVRARIFIFTVFRLPEKEKKGKKSTKKKKRPKRGDATEETDTEERIREQSDPAVSEEIESPAVSVAGQENKAPDADEDDFRKEKPETQDDGKKSLSAKIRDIIAKIKYIVEKIKGFFQNIQYTIRKICDKIKAVSDNIQYYREVLESDSFVRSVNLCEKELVWLFKKLKPDKCEADFIVGMEDPAATGEILAVYGMLYPLIGQRVRIVGNFECEKMRIEGRLYIRGRIRVVTFLRIAIRIYFNRDIRQLIRLLKKEAV